MVSPTTAPLAATTTSSPLHTDLQLQPTDITISKYVNPHDETTTTTTTIHIPFTVTEQSPPPKVISWMKGPRAARKERAQHSRKHGPSHGHERLQRLLPFLQTRKDETENVGHHLWTIFAIQVTLQGKVLLPSLMMDSVESNRESIVPAQLVPSETTSFVIHRTFQDFQRLSEKVMRLQSAAAASPGHPSAKPTSGDCATSTAALSPLRVRHPHPGPFHLLLKQFSFSNAKANQRAFDASSTTHGFDEEGAFERILELNQYLDGAWQLLRTPSLAHLTVELQDIRQWLSPSPKSAQADGRQMREKATEPVVITRTPTGSRPLSPTVASPTTMPMPFAHPVIETNEVMETTAMEVTTADSETVAAKEPELGGLPAKRPSSVSLPSLSSSSSSMSSAFDEVDRAEEDTSKLPSLPSRRDPRRRDSILDKAKRRISMSHVFKSFGQQDREQRPMSMVGITTVPTIPMQEEVYIWNTVTTSS